MNCDRGSLKTLARIWLCALAVSAESIAGADRTCSVALLSQVRQIASQVRSEDPNVSRAKAAVLQQFPDVTAEDLDEAIAHELSELERLARGISNGPTPAEVLKAIAALAFARENGLRIEAALMKAIKQGDADLVEGFIVMTTHGSGICDKPGYERFCKRIDFAAGWKNENYVVEAGNTSLRAARALIRAGAPAPLEELVMTRFGAQASAVAIEVGARASFQELIPLENEAAAVSLVELGLKLTNDDLRLTIEKNRAEIFEAALKHQPELAGAYDASGAFPLYYAVQFDRPQMVLTLLKVYGVKVDQRVKKDKNMTALMLASFEGRLECLRILLAEGADPNLATESGLTALMSPAQGDTVSILLDGGADPNLSSADNWRPLHRAVVEALFDPAFISHVRELVLAGADVNAITTRTIELDYARIGAADKKSTLDDGGSPLNIVEDFLDTSGGANANSSKKLKDYLVENGAL